MTILQNFRHIWWVVNHIKRGYETAPPPLKKTKQTSIRADKLLFFQNILKLLVYI